MNHIKSLLVILALSVLFFPLAAQNIDFQEKGWDKALKKAKKQDKLIFVDAYTTWCGPCKWMAANVFTDQSVADFYNAEFINVKLDMEAGEGVDFADTYDVVAFPTLLFINGDGDVVHKRLGAVPADIFLEFGQQALDPEERIIAYVEEYENGNRDPEFLKQYITRLASAGMDPLEAADQYFNQLSVEDLATKENMILIRMMRPDMNDPVFAKVAENRDAFAAATSDEMVDDFLGETCKTELLQNIYHEDDDAFAATIARIESLHIPMEEEIILYGKMRHSWGNGDYKTFIKLADKYARNYAWDDWNQLNTIAWDIYEDNAYSSEEYINLGLELAKRSVEINENYYNSDTYAALLYRAGMYQEAQDWAGKAIEHAKVSGMDFSETSALLTRINNALKIN